MQHHNAYIYRFIIWNRNNTFSFKNRRFSAFFLLLYFVRSCCSCCYYSENFNSVELIWPEKMTACGKRKRKRASLIDSDKTYNNYNKKNRKLNRTKKETSYKNHKIKKKYIFIYFALSVLSSCVIYLQSFYWTNKKNQLQLEKIEKKKENSWNKQPKFERSRRFICHISLY